MFERAGNLHISLAAKCQILFGAAVVLIISAALFVPWQRMEQLTDQLNERAAGAVARTTVAQHVWQERYHRDHARALPTTQPQLGEDLMIDGQPVLPPRIIGTDALGDPKRLTRFETSAMQRFLRDRKLPFYARFYETKAADGGYRYAQPVFGGSECIECHLNATPAQANILPTIAATRPTTQPAPLLGLVSVDIPSQVSTRQLLLNRVFILTAGMIGGTLAVIIFYLVTSRLILQPMRVLQETAEKVSRGDLNIRSDINSGDEFQVLSETFNTMLANLKLSADQLRAVNKSLDMRLGQMAETNVSLYESNRLKNEFLANVSHELRTPLNSILGFAELLKEQVLRADVKTSRYVQNIMTAGHNLLDLINDLLDLAKIEAGRMEVRSEPLSLPDLFEALIGLLKPLLEERRLTIVPIIGANVPIIETDPGKLQQILYNFLSNAIKFSPADARIDLSATLTETGERVRLEVTDRGPGIEAAQHAVIFEKFRQLDGSVTRTHSGTGLGLAISKELGTLLSGVIALQSEPGKGSTFSITLPLRIVARQADVRTEVGK